MSGASARYDVYYKNKNYRIKLFCCFCDMKLPRTSTKFWDIIRISDANVNANANVTFLFRLAKCITYIGAVAVDGGWWWRWWCRRHIVIICMFVHHHLVCDCACIHTCGDVVVINAVNVVETRQILLSRFAEREPSRKRNQTAACMSSPKMDINAVVWNMIRIWVANISQQSQSTIKWL